MGTESSRRRTAQPVPVASAVLAWKSIGFECSSRLKLQDYLQVPCCARDCITGVLCLLALLSTGFGAGDS